MLPETLEKVGGLRCCARGREDRLRVALQEVEPVLDESGMAQFAWDLQRCTEEGGGQFGDQLLGGIGASSETPREVPVKPLQMSAPVRMLVQDRRVREYRKSDGSGSVMASSLGR